MRQINTKGISAITLLRADRISDRYVRIRNRPAYSIKRPNAEGDLLSFFFFNFESLSFFWLTISR